MKRKVITIFLTAIVIVSIGLPMSRLIQTHLNANNQTRIVINDPQSGDSPVKIFLYD